MSTTRHHVQRRAAPRATATVMGLALVGALVGALATPAPADAAPPPSIDAAALLAVPAPVCDIVVTPSRLTASDEISVTGPLNGLKTWIEELLSDPGRWGLTEYEYLEFVITVHPRLASYPLADGPVIVADAAAVEARSKELYGPDSSAFDIAIAPNDIPLRRLSFTGNDPASLLANFLSNVESTFTASLTVSATTLQSVIDNRWMLTDPFPLELDVFVALRVGPNMDRSDQRGILMPCTLPDPPAEQLAAPSPQLDVTCASDVPRAGEPLACTLHGAPADVEFLWRASVNPTVAEGVITTGADGTGDFTIAVPTDVVGQLLSVEIVAWTAPMPLGVVAGPVPTSVPAGLGQPAALSGTGRWAWVSAAGLMALAGVAALHRVGT